MYLIDASAWIFALRKNFHPTVKDRITRLLSEETVATTGIIQMELLAGTVSEKEYHRLWSRLSALYYIESTQARRWGEEVTGKPEGLHDE